MTNAGLYCYRCDTHYDDPDEAFYWEERAGAYRRPCKKCIAEYNKQPDQYRKRLEASKRYQRSKKGKQSRIRTIKRRKQKSQRTIKRRKQ